MMTDEARKAFLESDPWTKNVEPRAVTCVGCNQILSLDKRKGAYYSSLWLKHRDACRAIQRILGKSVEKSVRTIVNINA
jgi:hypothetical protein